MHGVLGATLHSDGELGGDRQGAHQRAGGGQEEEPDSGVRGVPRRRGRAAHRYQHRGHHHCCKTTPIPPAQASVRKQLVFSILVSNY